MHTLFKRYSKPLYTIATEFRHTIHTQGEFPRVVRREEEEHRG